MAAVIPWKLSSSKHSHLNLPQKTQWNCYTALFQSCCQVLRGLKFLGGRVVYKVPKEGVGVLSIIFHKLEKGMMFTKTVLICDPKP